MFYRLETFSLRIPPLRERGTDIEHLVFALIDKHAEAQGKQIEQIEPEALNSLLNYSYPGNVRELENAIMRAVTLSEAGVLQHQDLPERLREQSSQQKSSTDTTPTLSGRYCQARKFRHPRLPVGQVWKRWKSAIFAKCWKRQGEINGGRPKY
ncbi:hypothetical protein HAALTHF_23050n [Vreelandella aquamarina]|nr:hypothetical protein HAALTHF_23050n [Halomonas axialensis]